MGKIVVITLLITLGFIAVVIIINNVGSGESVNNDTTATLSADSLQKEEPVNYTIVSFEESRAKAMTKPLSSYTSAEIQQLPINKKNIYRVVVESGITREQVESTIEKIVGDITAEDKDIDEIGIFMFDDISIVNGAWNVASGIWAPQGKFGNVTPEIARTNNRKGYDITIRFGVAVK